MMAFPISHKTVFVLDHTLSSPCGQKLDLDNLSKSKSGSNGASSNSSSVQHIPLLPIIKCFWTCAVEALAEYCRIVWDIFPSSKLIRFISLDESTKHLNGWNAEDQNLQALNNIFLTLGPAKKGVRAILESGIQAGLNALTEPSAVQLEKRKLFADDATKVSNKGRIILVTHLEGEGRFKDLKDKIHDMIVQTNKRAATTDNLMPINHCEFVVVNLCKDNKTSAGGNQVLPDVSTFLSCELFNIDCSSPIASRLGCLVLRNYDLASTTVTGIPMKEEQNASSSANYDVELFHPALAHTAIFKGIPSETAHLKTIKSGTDYETVTLRWCTPRSTACSELHHCSSVYRITSVDVNSRPSSCLTNFLINGRWVMLEMPRKSGTKVTSHMLASHGGDIYIHTLHITRSILEDPPSISEGCGGRVTDYRLNEFSQFIRSNLLSPSNEITLEEGEDAVHPLDSAKDHLSHITRMWPLTHSSTSLFNLLFVVEPLCKTYLKKELSEDDVNECKQVIFQILSMEGKQEPLPSPSADRRLKGLKPKDQYKGLYAELERYLRLYLLSPNHHQVLTCLLECTNKSYKSDKLSDDKVAREQALMEIDTVYDLVEKPEPAKVEIPTRKKKRPMHADNTFGKRNKTSLFAMLQNSADLDTLRPTLRGREDPSFKLYAHFKEKDDRKKQ